MFSEIFCIHSILFQLETAGYLASLKEEKN